MLVTPMIGSWQPPRIERLRSFEARRLVVVPVAGLSGDLHQDLGRGALSVEIVGSLSTDEARDQFLTDVREKFLSGDPVDFVADIVKESELEQVLIDSLELQEAAGDPDAFRYRIVLREYTEPPEPPAPLEPPDLGDLADIGLDMLDLPAILTELPAVGEILEPLAPAAEKLAGEVAKAGDVFKSLGQLFDGGAG